MNTVVTLMGAPAKWASSLPEASAAVASFSDGYQMQIETTLGAALAAGAETSACLQHPMGVVVCAGAYGADDDGQLANYGAGWIDAADWNEAGMLLSVFKPFTAENVAIASTPVKAPVAEGDDPTYPENAVAAGALLSSVWYQPKGAETYAGVPRFEKGMMVKSFASFGEGVENEDGATVWPKTACGDFTLMGASTILASAAVAFSAAALL
jgi:hypothetical protein